MKKYRVLIVTSDGLVPPDNSKDLSDEVKGSSSWKMEYDVMVAIEELGHEVAIIGVFDDLGLLRRTIEEFKPDIVFNLVHEFHGVGVYDHHIAAYLELLRQPYTGCNPRGLMLSRDKILAKKLMQYHRIQTPRFLAYRLNKPFRKPTKLSYPMVVKSSVEDASLGVSQASVVHNEDKLRERVAFVHEQVQSDAVVEEYIEGRELYLGVLGNVRLNTFPPWEIVFPDLPESSMPIATNRAKWNRKYRLEHKIHSRAAYKLPEAVEKQIPAFAKKIYRTLFLTGYARLDCRLRSDGTLFCLEANANCDLSLDDEFALSGDKAGISYPELVQKIISLGLQYKPAWKRAEALSS
ncbi:MAG: hypothetical protein KDD66_14650 [Bdellovibrionales bacterium]|nr:hypothetical protein [Bdellovibrionales bacterium]